jgi:aminobenzoyl-glutamate utilization protein B
MNARDEIVASVEKKKEAYIEAACKIWDNPELAFHEDKSAATLIEILEKEGFSVKRGLAGMSTAFLATYGSGSPVIGIMGEYDALPGLSQESGCTERKPVVEGGPGHGCGHNLLGTAGVAAVVAMKDYMEAHGVKGTIRYYGCPAEEGGSGKAYMAREGLFDDLDAAFSWHPSRWLAPWMLKLNASLGTEFHFTGKASHAASAPQMGRSALDACELMNVGCNYLREHISSEAKLHYAYLDAGGTSPNIVQAHAAVKYLFRAPTVEEAIDIRSRVEDIARGAALMTGTTVEVIHREGYSNYVPNTALTKLMGQAVEEVGPISYDEADYELAKKFRASLPEDCTRNIDWRSTGLSAADAAEYFRTHVLYDRPGKYLGVDANAPASTDMGDVSHCVPTAQVEVPCYTIGTPNHTWQMAAQTRTSIGQKGMLEAAKCLALCGIKVLEDDGTILAEARKEFDTMMGGRKYSCPFPDELHPPR